MRSTFMGLEASKRGLFTQQSALYTTGHNISNANTVGYSRQKVNMEPTLGYPGVGLDTPKTAGFIGTGVQASAVQRVRDDFVDKQFRQETNKLGYWEARSHNITQMEDILNEPSDYGLAKSMNEFWNSLQDLNVNPEDGGARAVVVQRAIAVADSFHYMSNSINQLKENAGEEIGILLKDTNSILEQIASLNQQIIAVEPNGYMPNDLYDARDNLIDQLSTYFPVEIEQVKSGGNSLAIAEGSLTVSLKLTNGKTIKLVDGKNYAQLRNSGLDTETDGITPNGAVTGLHIVKVNEDKTETFLSNDWSTTEQTINNISSFSALGKYKGLVESYGYKSGIDANGLPIERGLLPQMLSNLNLMAQEFASEFNRVHKLGTDLSGNTGENFFVENGAVNPNDNEAVDGITAGNIYVSSRLINDQNLIAASDSQEIEESLGVFIPNPEPGNGKNALNLANVKFTKIDALEDVSVQTYFEGLIGQLGVDGQQAYRLQYNAQTLQQAVTERRASISSVSLDEEMTNMITFQQAYNANARMITVIDETLDKIINGLGRVGL
ncbi:flagellar hook-associated protein FlgK [Ureibacillus manganicus]|uniref:Flagellar hook-associated protein 1 n=1 Tax=Ureibacillus manganicus DSM 26584 TaxID=1384049 RepID=A0A0A3J0N4_9BACL|nr:flagellar hook-associated protein FlgK [Ureibacillus manganicus]KGR80617.1 flagellar hook protein FlgK [Ureibacillus manganicus DSM 26584]